MRALLGSLLLLGIAAAAAVAAGRFSLESPAFRAGARIPRAYTCAGHNVSPPLRWSSPPPGTRAFAVSVVDLDAANFRHWLG